MFLNFAVSSTDFLPFMLRHFYLLFEADQSFANSVQIHYTPFPATSCFFGQKTTNTKCCFHGDQMKDVEAVKLDEERRTQAHSDPFRLVYLCSSHADGVLVELHDDGSRLLHH